MTVISQRLETLLALIEGWVDEVTFQVARTWLPSHDQLAEAVRRGRFSVDGRPSSRG